MTVMVRSGRQQQTIWKAWSKRSPATSRRFPRKGAIGSNMKSLLWITHAHLDHLGDAAEEAWFQKLEKSRADMLLLGGDTANARHSIYRPMRAHPQRRHLEKGKPACMSRSARSRTRIFTGQTRPRESALWPRSNRKTLPCLRHGVARLHEAHLDAIAGRRCLPPINPPKALRTAEAFRLSTESSRQVPQAWIDYIPINPQGKEQSSKNGGNTRGWRHSLTPHALTRSRRSFPVATM